MEQQVHNGHRVEQKGIILSEAIKEMENAIRSRDYSDAYLTTNSIVTRRESFAKEWCYGITMVPCTFALQLAKKVLEREGINLFYLIVINEINTN